MDSGECPPAFSSLVTPKPVFMNLAATIILGVGIALGAAMLAAVSRHRKSGTDDVRLVGSPGFVDTRLNPCGTVLIRGELWRACSSDGTGLDPGSRVKVVGTLDHLLLVRLQD